MKSNQAQRVGAIIAAAGESQRMGGIDKVTLCLANRQGFLIQTLDSLIVVERVGDAIAQRAERKGYSPGVIQFSIEG